MKTEIKFLNGYPSNLPQIRLSHLFPHAGAEMKDYAWQSYSRDKAWAAGKSHKRPIMKLWAEGVMAMYESGHRFPPRTARPAKPKWYEQQCDYCGEFMDECTCWDSDFDDRDFDVDIDTHAV